MMDIDTKIDLNRMKVELLELITYLKDEHSTKDKAIEKIIEIIKMVEECDIPITKISPSK
jgi:uncharacterized protein YeeX (DUF496 family)